VTHGRTRTNNRTTLSAVAAMVLALCGAPVHAQECDEGVWSPFVSGGEIGVGHPDLSASVSATTIWNGDLIAGGSFITAGGETVNRIARWDGSAWHPFTAGGEIGVNGNVIDLTVWNGDLIAGGSFTTAGGQTVNHIARWDGSTWNPFTSGGQIGVSSAVRALTVWNGDLSAAGHFETAGGQTVNRIARWDGSAWHPFTSGGEIGVSGGNVGTNIVYALKGWNGDLVAGGWFNTAGGETVNRIARWDGSAWHPFSSGGQIGVSSPGSGNPRVYALTVINGDLIAGGLITMAGGQTINSIARWDGSTWHPFISGGEIGVGSGWVQALMVWNGNLIAGGGFTTAGGQTVNRIARWDGLAWHPFTAGGQIGTSGQGVRALTAWNDDLIAGGWFATAGGKTVNNIAAWTVATEFWAGDALGSYHNPFNWACGTVPIITTDTFFDTFEFKIPNEIEVTFDEGDDAFNRTLSINSGDITYRLIGRDYTIVEDSIEEPSLVIGFYPGIDASLTLENTATTQSFFTAGSILLGAETGCFGSLDVGSSASGAGISLQAWETIDIGLAGIGTLRVFNGNEVATSAINNFTGGTIGGDGSLATPLLLNLGTVSPHSASFDAGTLNLDGNYAQIGPSPNGIGEASGLLRIGVSGSGEHDGLGITGTASLGGGLFGEWLGGTPIMGTTFPFLSAGAVDPNFNRFDVAVMPALSNGFFLDVEHDGKGGSSIGVDFLTTILDFNPTQEAFTAQGTAVGVVTADFNGNGLDDIAIALQDGSNGMVLVLFNAGDGTNFTPLQIPLAPGAIPTALVAGDFLGNGFPDIAVTNAANDTVTIIANFGWAFAPLFPPINVGSDPSGIAAADLNGNGYLDLAVTAAGEDAVYLLFNTGIGDFSVNGVIGVGAEPHGVAAANFLPSQGVDLAVANRADGTVMFLENIGGGSFAFDSIIPTGSGAWHLSPADLDDDKDIDLIVSNTGATTITFLMNYGDGTFAPPVNVEIGGQPGPIVMGDMDNDGTIDFGVIVDDPEQGLRLQVYRNDTNLETSIRQFVITPAKTISTGNPLLAVGGDMTGDGTIDLVTIGPNAGAGLGSSQAVVRVSRNESGECPSCCDFTIDGDTILYGSVTSSNIFVQNNLTVAGTSVVLNACTISVGGDIVVADGAHLLFGVGTLANAASLQIMSGGTATILSPNFDITFTDLTIEPGGELNWNAGTIRVVDGIVTTHDPLKIGCLNQAELVLTDSMVIGPSVQVCAMGILSGTGIVDAALANAGRIQPGLPIGELIISGDFAQAAAGILAVNIGGVQPGSQHDVVTVLGSSTLAGLLEVSLADRYEPELNETFAILTSYGQMIDQFTKMYQPDPDAEALLVVYEHDADTNNVIVTRPKVGDLNGDGVVDVSDLLILLANWGPCPRSAACPADLNGDSVVDVSDLLLLLANWG